MRERERGKSVEKGRGKYREGGSLLTKDGVKMEGEKYGKGDPRCYSPSLPLFLTRFLLGVPVGIRLPKCAGRFRNFAGGIPRAMRQLFKTISISAKEGYSLFNAATYKWKYLKSIGTVSVRKKRRDGSTSKCAILVVAGRLANDDAASLYSQIKMQFAHYGDDYANRLPINKSNSVFVPLKC